MHTRRVGSPPAQDKRVMEQTVRCPPPEIIWVVRVGFQGVGGDESGKFNLRRLKGQVLEAGPVQGRGTKGVW